jgi:hypothetical protein
MTEPADAFELGVTIASALDAAGIPNALGGAIALAAWGIPRATVDVDINVFVEDERVDEVLDVLERDVGIEVDRDAARRGHVDDGLMILKAPSGMRIDVFTPSIEFSWEAARTATRLHVLEAEVSVLSAEALAVFKLLFFRSKDIADLERLVATQQERMDVDYVRRHIADMLGDADPRVAKWDELVAQFG